MLENDDIAAGTSPGANDTTIAPPGVNGEMSGQVPGGDAPPAPAPAGASPDGEAAGSVMTKSDAATLDEIFAYHAAKPEGFDEALHAVNPDGSPRLRSDGTFAMKRGRKKGQTASARKAAPLPGEKTTAPKVDEVSDAEITARMATNLLINGCVVVFGDEWQPANPSEPQMIAGAFTDYFEAKGVTKLPPEWGLVIALGAYALPRFTKPNTRDRLAYLKAKFSGVFSRFKKKKRGDAGAE